MYATQTFPLLIIMQKCKVCTICRLCTMPQEPFWWEQVQRKLLTGRTRKKKENKENTSAATPSLGKHCGQLFLI